MSFLKNIGVGNPFIDVAEAFSRTGDIEKGKLVKNITVGVAASTFTHSLGRQALGAICVRRTPSSAVIGTDIPDRYTVEVISDTANTVADFWVF